MLTYVAVAIGGALGSVARFGLSGFIARGLDEVFPWGTLIVNISGCFIIGLFAVVTGPEGRVLVPSEYRQLVMVGFCGGYTTFSSFSLQTLILMKGGDMTRASLNLVASVLFCMLGVYVGSALGALLNQGRGT